MNNARLKWFLILLMPLLYLWMSISQGAPQQIEETKKLLEPNGTDWCITEEYTSDEPCHEKAKVFRNKKGLKSQINIVGPLREMNAVSRTKTETVEELIEDISIWIPQMYRQRFSVNPRCIIVLETKVNEAGKAEIRFGVAMECTPKQSASKIIFI
jgi:hypothetical protein